MDRCPSSLCSRQVKKCILRYYRLSAIGHHDGLMFFPLGSYSSFLAYICRVVYWWNYLSHTGATVSDMGAGWREIKKLRWLSWYFKEVVHLTDLMMCWLLESDKWKAKANFPFFFSQSYLEAFAITTVIWMWCSAPYLLSKMSFINSVRPHFRGWGNFGRMCVSVQFLSVCFSFINELS